MYQDKIGEYAPLTIDNIIHTAETDIPQRFRSMPWAYSDAEGRTLEHGTAILETEELCSAYLAAYGRMHRKKLYFALDGAKEKGNFPYQELRNGIELFDWGCGQGIGSMAVIENLRKEGLLSCLKKITLEEPSEVARARAVQHVKHALGTDSNVIVEQYSEYLPSDYSTENTIQSITIEQPCAIHIFSNVLDIESVSLKGVSKLITSSGVKHIVLCIGPANLNESRINAFKNYFKDNDIQVFADYRETKFGKHPNGRDYGCLIKSFAFSLDSAESVLHKYKCFAPIQLFACYAETMPEQKKRSIKDGAFEIMAPFDMTIHKGLNPILALVSNLISRGVPTYASEYITSALSHRDKMERETSLKAIAQIQKTIVEAMITGRLDIQSAEWNVLTIKVVENEAVHTVARERPLAADREQAAPVTDDLHLISRTQVLRRPGSPLDGRFREKGRIFGRIDDTLHAPVELRSQRSRIGGDGDPQIGIAPQQVGGQQGRSPDALAMLGRHGDDKPADAPGGECLQYAVVGLVKPPELQKGIDSGGKQAERRQIPRRSRFCGGQVLQYIYIHRSVVFKLRPVARRCRREAEGFDTHGSAGFQNRRIRQSQNSVQLFERQRKNGTARCSGYRKPRTMCSEKDRRRRRSGWDVRSCGVESEEVLLKLGKGEIVGAFPRLVGCMEFPPDGNQVVDSIGVAFGQTLLRTIDYDRGDETTLFRTVVE